MWEEAHVAEDINSGLISLSITQTSRQQVGRTSPQGIKKQSNNFMASL